MTNSKHVIFDLTDETNIYKGVLFAEVDLKELGGDMGLPFPKDFFIGFVALIWTDKDGNWHYKQRVKFPNGNKQAASKSFGKDVNETKILQEIYKFPLKHKVWTKNPDGTGMGILKIIEDLDMIESKRILSPGEV